MSFVMHLCELLACLALISSSFVSVVAHVIQKGYLFWCYGDTFGYLVRGLKYSAVSQTLMSTSMEREYQVR